MLQIKQLENEHFDSTGEVAQVSSFTIGNSWLQQDITFTLSEATTLWRFSIDTVTGSEAGFERTHQGSCLTLLWPLLLEPGQRWSVEILCDGKPSRLIFPYIFSNIKFHLEKSAF